MEYNLYDFGKEMKRIRKIHGMTQNYVYETLGIHPDTLRKIENGNHIPLHETLDILSNLYKVDLNNLLLTYRFDNYNYLREIIKRLKSKIDEDDYKSLDTELKELNIIIEGIHSTYYINITKQLILLIEAIILYKNKDSYDTSLNKLIEAMKITTPHFSLNNYRSFIYSKLEIKIIMNIALIINELDYKEECKAILKFCIESVESNSTFYPKLCHNLAETYMEEDNHEKALKYFDLGISFLKESRSINGLSLLYYGNALSEFYLGRKEYMQSFKKALVICDVLEQDKLRRRIIENCKKTFNIEL